VGIALHSTLHGVCYFVSLLRLLFLIQLNLEHMNLLELGIEHSVNNHALTLKTVHQVGAVGADRTGYPPRCSMQ
jgi:hypothetical protein